MGTRSLSGPWLITDDRRDEELAMRRRLLVTRRDEVLAAPSSADAASVELLRLVGASGVALDVEVDHPLAVLGRSIQEDCCLLVRGEREWELEAAILCFPSRWRLAAKLGRPLREVHGPTPDYDPVLADRITSLLDALVERPERIVHRRNWFLHPDGSLFQPDRPVDGDPLIPADRCGDALFVRSERQTLRVLPSSGRIVFTIRIQQCSVGEAIAADPGFAGRLDDYLTGAADEQRRHRGIATAQVEPLRRALVGTV